MNGLDASALCALPRFPALRVAARATKIDSKKSRRVTSRIVLHLQTDRLYRGVGGLIEDASHLSIAFGTAVTVIHAGSTRSLTPASGAIPHRLLRERPQLRVDPLCRGRHRSPVVGHDIGAFAGERAVLSPRFGSNGMAVRARRH